MLRGIAAGSRPNGRDAQGRTPLQILVENEAVWGKTFGDVVDVMLSYGARIDEVTDSLSLTNLLAGGVPVCSY